MNAWSGKQCLALKLTNGESGFGLIAHLPEAWHLTGSTNLPVEALPSIDLYLAYKGIDDPSEFKIPFALARKAAEHDAIAVLLSPLRANGSAQYVR